MTDRLPITAWYMGYGGLLPFFILSVLLLLGIDTLPFSSSVSVAQWLLVYAATIISFIGAVHWGVVLGKLDQLAVEVQQRHIAYSVVPALLAWLAILLPTSFAFFAMAACIGLAYWFDRQWLFPVVSADYARLRIHLSMVVVLLLLAAAIATAPEVV